MVRELSKFGDSFGMCKLLLLWLPVMSARVPRKDELVLPNRLLSLLLYRVLSVGIEMEVGGSKP